MYDKINSINIQYHSSVMMTSSTRKLILILIIILSIVVVSCLTHIDKASERDYENEDLSLKVPANWSVDEKNDNEYNLAILRPLNARYPYIIVAGYDRNMETPSDYIDHIIKMYPIEEPRFEVVTRETVDINGGKGEKLVYISTAHDDIFFIGPDHYFAVVVFETTNQSITISTSETTEHTFYSQIEPALDVVLNSIKIKEN